MTRCAHANNSGRRKGRRPRRQRSVVLLAPSGRCRRLDEPEAEYKRPKLREAEAEAEARRWKWHEPEAGKVKLWFNEAKLKAEAGFVPNPNQHK